jgi:hypothetical protein
MIHNPGGYKPAQPTSDFPPKADMVWLDSDVCFVPEADIP